MAKVNSLHKLRQWIPIGSLLVTCIFDVVAGLICLVEAVGALHYKHQGTTDFVCDQNAFMTSVLAIMAAHGLAHFVGGCDRNAWNVIKKWESGAIANLILIWCAFVVEFALLKHSHGKKNGESNSPCRITHPNELFVGGIACIVHIAFTTALYVVMLNARNKASPQTGTSGGVV